MKMATLRWWTDGTPSTFHGISIGSGQAYLGLLVGLLLDSGVEKIDISHGTETWVRSRPDHAGALAEALRHLDVHCVATHRCDPLSSRTPCYGCRGRWALEAYEASLNPPESS